MSVFKKPRTSRARIAAATAAIVGMAIVPIALSAPAQAATAYACTVTPLKPVFAGFNSSGVKLVDYRIQASCTQDRYVYIQQQLWEEDDWPNDDDYMGSANYSKHLNAASGTVVLHNVRALANGEWGNEEVYHKARFKVGSGGVWSAFTGWQNSYVLDISD